MSKKITELSTVTHAAGDKVVIYDSSAGDVALVDASNLLTTVSSTNRVLGRSTAGAGAIEEIVCNQTARDVMAAANANAARIVLGGGTNTLAKLKDSASTKDAVIDNSALTAAREYRVPNVAGELVIEPTTPTYWLRAFSDTRRPDQWVNVRDLVCFVPTSTSFTLVPSQVPVKLPTLTGASIEWRVNALWALNEFQTIVGGMYTQDFNDSVGDVWMSRYNDLITSSTYCSHPLTNVLTGATDSDQTVITGSSLPTYADNVNIPTLIRCVVGTNGTDIYYFNTLIQSDLTAGYNQKLIFESGNSWQNLSTGATPTLRTATSLVGTTTFTNILLNNNQVRGDSEGAIVMVATIRMPV